MLDLEHARHILTHLAHAVDVLQLAGGQLKAQVEQFVPRVGQALLEICIRKRPQIGCLGHGVASLPFALAPTMSACSPRPGKLAAMPAAESLPTKRAWMGSLWAASSSASLARSSRTPATSKRIRPGRTTQM